MEEESISQQVEEATTQRNFLLEKENYVQHKTVVYLVKIFKFIFYLLIYFSLVSFI